MSGGQGGGVPQGLVPWEHEEEYLAQTDGSGKALEGNGSLLSSMCSKLNGFKFYDSDPQPLTAFKYFIDTNPCRVGPTAHRTLQHCGMCHEFLAQ